MDSTIKSRPIRPAATPVVTGSVRIQALQNLNFTPVSEPRSSKQKACRGALPGVVSLPVPQATLDDVVQTLGSRRWRLFGISFGPKNRVTEVLLRTDPSGMALGAYARVSGRLVTLNGDLFARIVDRQFALLPQAQTSEDFTAVAQAQPISLPLREAPTAVGLSPPLGSSSLSAGSATTWSSGISSFGSSAASSRTSLSHLPSPLMDTSQMSPAALTAARWQRYCDYAAEPGYYATSVEVAATALALGIDIRVVSMARLGSAKHFYVSDFAGKAEGEPKDAPLLLLCDLQHQHYQPLLGDGTQLMSRELLHSEMTPAVQQEVYETLMELAQDVPGDGSCFFHSVALLLDHGAEDSNAPSAQQARAQAIAFLRAHGETHKTVTALGQLATLSADFLDNLPASKREKLEAELPDAPVG